MGTLKLGRAIAAGLVGTAVMTMLMLAAPMMGLPPMKIGDMLGQFLGIGAAAGWVMHFVIGVILATIYAWFVAARLPGPVAVRGAVYGFAVFLVAQLVVTPMMGGGVFSGGNIPMIMGSLLGHLVYGGLVGAVYGHPSPASAPQAQRA
ncbi:MAG: hypothetical protein HY700_10930 [Gemmatimonadetes bacterium]|nr:hypothetical protein [Gemmatimonadota bacterium]